MTITYNDWMLAIAKMKNQSFQHNYFDIIDKEKPGVVFNTDLENLRGKLGYPKKLGD